MAVAAAGALSVTISAIDRLSGPLATMNSGALRLAAGVSRLNNAARSTMGMDRLSRLAGAVARNIALIVPPLSALTAAGSIAGVLRLAGSWATLGAQLTRTAYRVQSTASALFTMRGAAALSGASAEELTQGLQGLGDALSDAVGGRDDTAGQYFRLLGIGLRDAAGQARTATEVLPEVADGIARIADPRLQARVLGALRLPAGLLPYLRQGAAGMREYEREARRAGAISEEGAEAARQFELAQIRLNLAGQGLVNTLAARLAPVLVPLIDRLSNWLITEGPRLGAIVEDLAGRFTAWVDGGGLTRLGERLEAVGTGISTVIGWMGGMENAAILLGVALLAHVLAPLTRIVRALGSITTFRLAPWLLRLLSTGATGGLAAGAFILHPTPLNAGEEAQLDRLRRDPEALRRELELAPPRPAGLPSLEARLGAFFRQRWAPSLPAAPAARPGDPAEPRGIRNNNPLNLMWHPGQLEANPGLASDGRFGVYPTMEAGIAQAIRQLQRNARRGDDTLARQISRWAPPGENNTAAYIAAVSRAIGIAPNETLDLRDAAVLRRLVAAMAVQENGRALDPAVIDRGVALGLAPAGASAPSPATAAGPLAAGGGESRSVVELRFSGQVPPGLTAITRREDGGVRIERPGLGAGP
ncbi:hypothetical protein HB662_02250 [Roseomonas frigidaquae]|uniref:Phage tail tape measure protein n=1 Tax=Falsiroseomonas frigidaquae TaxID=487318 RepID=A0ABX1ESI7_9PROT|nr:hypothetical protein [Falsiroseomonas frigidaquae]NKE43581.1 hypothetical protein [Falsiroseomonas frigidaquae]